MYRVFLDCLVWGLVSNARGLAKGPGAAVWNMADILSDQGLTGYPH